MHRYFAPTAGGRDRGASQRRRSMASISTISANLSSNPQTGEAWYTARVRISKHEHARLGSLILHAGIAGRGVYPDRRTLGAVLSGQATNRSNRKGNAGRIGGRRTIVF